MSNFHPLTDEEWGKIQSLMSWSPEKKERGTKRSNFRQVWNSILYVIVNHARWNDIPKDSVYAHRSSAHRWLLRWEQNGVLKRVLDGLEQSGYFKDKPHHSAEATDSLLKSMKRRNRGAKIEKPDSTPPTV